MTFTPRKFCDDTPERPQTPANGTELPKDMPAHDTRPPVGTFPSSHTYIPSPSAPNRTEPTTNAAGAAPGRGGPVFQAAAVHESRHVVATETRVEAVQPRLLCFDVPAAIRSGIGYPRAIVIAGGR